MKIEEVKCKSVLTKSNLPEVDYCINPYVGCLHKCLYCYARFMRRFTGHKEDWGDFLDVKVNSPEVLRQELLKRPNVGEVLLGSVTDSYQPLERKYKITRELVEILLEHDFPVSILSKSDLVLRDIDLFKRFTSCEVGFSVTTVDDSIARDFEPFASTPSKRISALAKLHQNGISTYAFIGPILPGLTDIDEICCSLLGKVDYVMIEGLNLRCGNWKDLEMILRRKYPNHLKDFLVSKENNYWKSTCGKIERLVRRYGIPLKGCYYH